ncbi:MAG: hypothetical protein ACYSUI_13185, partial [Planctomycetota bacterium]
MSSQVVLINGRVPVWRALLASVVVMLGAPSFVAASGFTAYNDCVYDPGLDGTGTDPNGQSVHYTAANVTVYGIGEVTIDQSGQVPDPYAPTSGLLVDQATGAV